MTYYMLILYSTVFQYDILYQSQAALLRILHNGLVNLLSGQKLDFSRSLDPEYHG
jgi:hypothetical protein